MAAVEPFRTLNSVYFDCDSTLSNIEGIDELAANATAEVRQQVVDLTNAAMDGTVPVEDVYGRRLEILRPTRASLDAVGALYIERVIPDAALVVRALREIGKRVGIVSGGLLPAVLKLADHLGVDRAHVHAVDVRFSPEGSYDAFDASSPLARSGGKPELLGALPTDHHPLAFVGDGVTDLETAPVVERFIGFGGVARRTRVVEGAEHFVEGPNLAPVLQFCLTPTERDRLASNPSFRDLLPGGAP